MKYNHIGIPTSDRFAGEIDLPHLKVTVSDHANNPFGIQWQRYWDDAPYPDLVKTVPHVALTFTFNNNVDTNNTHYTGTATFNPFGPVSYLPERVPYNSTTKGRCKSALFSS